MGALAGPTCLYLLLNHTRDVEHWTKAANPEDAVCLCAQESSEDVSGGLPFLADLALGLSVLACSMLRILYNGPEVTREEEACHDLLCSKLLQR